MGFGKQAEEQGVHFEEEGTKPHSVLLGVKDGGKGGEALQMGKARGGVVRAFEYHVLLGVASMLGSLDP